jgi:hypothetical protein
MRADQKGTRSVSVLAIVACIPDPRIDSRPAPEAYPHAQAHSHANVSTAS